MKKYILLAFAFCAVLLFSCRGKKSVNERPERVVEDVPVASLVPLVIYKTWSDFSNNVPVIMNADKTRIISYPDPSDLFYGGELATPVSLNDDYLLDRRGITRDVAFLNYTYKEYSALESAPALEQMLRNIKEKYPLSEFIDCSTCKTEKTVSNLNKLIESDFPDCDRTMYQIMIDFE